jgi:hypothetical protein
VSVNTKVIREQLIEIGHSLHAARISKKLTLTKLSRFSSVPVDLLDQFEMGKNRMHVDDLLKIALAMKVEIGEMLFSL